LDRIKHPERVFDFMPKDWAEKETRNYLKSIKSSGGRFFESLSLLATAFDAANKIVDEKGNGREVLNEIFNRVFSFPEIVRALDDLHNAPEEITRECLAAMDKASGGVVDSRDYSEILDYFLDQYENDLIEKIESASGNEKERLARELKDKRFEMFPIVFNGMTHNVREGFKRFIVKTPLAKRVFPFNDEVREGSPVYGNDFDIGGICFVAHRVCDFAPDENGCLHIPLRGGGGCACGAGSPLRNFSLILKELLGIEDREMSAPEIVPVPDKPVSEYAARFVLNYQETPEEKFTFRRDDGGAFEVSLDDAKMCYCKFIKRLIAESKTENHGWVVIKQPDWLNHRGKLPKVIRELVQCVEKRDINGVSSFRITGKPQEWARGAPIKKPNFE